MCNCVYLRVENNSECVNVCVVKRVSFAKSSLPSLNDHSFIPHRVLVRVFSSYVHFAVAAVAAVARV